MSEREVQGMNLDLALRYLDQIEAVMNDDIDHDRQASPGFVISNVREVRKAIEAVRDESLPAYEDDEHNGRIPGR